MSFSTSPSSLSIWSLTLFTPSSYGRFCLTAAITYSVTASALSSFNLSTTASRIALARSEGLSFCHAISLSLGVLAGLVSAGGGGSSLSFGGTVGAGLALGVGIGAGLVSPSCGADFGWAATHVTETFIFVHIPPFDDGDVAGFPVSTWGINPLPLHIALNPSAASSAFTVASLMDHDVVMLMFLFP